MLNNLKLGDVNIKDSLKQLVEPLKWFGENGSKKGNKVALYLLDTLSAISKNDNDKQTENFLGVLKQFITVRQKLTEKHPEVMSSEYKEKTQELSNVFSGIKEILPPPADENPAIKKKNKSWPSKKGSSRTSESSVFTSKYKRKPINKQASHGMTGGSKKK